MGFLHQEKVKVTLGRLGCFSLVISHWTGSVGLKVRLWKRRVVFPTSNSELPVQGLKFKVSL